MSFIFTNSALENSQTLQSQWSSAQSRRNSAQMQNENLYHLEREVLLNEFKLNEAARLPTDAYRTIDARTKQLMTGDEGGVFLNDLLPLASSVSMGDIVAEYRRVSDSGNGQSSIGGNFSKNMDKATYDFEGGLVLIHEDAFGRGFREFAAMQSKGFNALIDDQANSVRAVRKLLVGHMVNGVPNVNYKGATADGIKTKALALDLDASGVNVDLTLATLTYADAEKAFIAAIKLIQGTNNAEGDVTFYVSNEIWFPNMLKRMSNDSNFETFHAALSAIAGVKEIKRTSDASLLTGNQFIAGILSDQYIQPIVGMAVNTMPIPRMMPYSEHNFVTWAATGILIKSDAMGRKAWVYARNIP